VGTCETRGTRQNPARCTSECWETCVAAIAQRTMS
jgi:hypothetical protein